MLSGNVRLNQNSFAGGIITGELQSRSDLEKYANGAADILNMTVRLQGGITRRPGMMRVADVAKNTLVRLVSFVYSNDQTYVLEFTNRKIRLICRSPEGFGVVTADGIKPFEIQTPYLDADLFELNFCQSYDTLFIAHPQYEPMKLSRKNHTDWELKKVIVDPGIGMAANVSVQQSGTVDMKGTDRTLTYYVVGLKSDGGRGSVSSGASFRTKAEWPAGGKLEVKWNTLDKAAKYEIYKEINGSGLGYIGEGTALTFTDNNIGPDTSRSPFASGTGISGTEQKIMQDFKACKTSGSRLSGDLESVFRSFNASRPMSDCYAEFIFWNPASLISVSFTSSKKVCKCIVYPSVDGGLLYNTYNKKSFRASVELIAMPDWEGWFNTVVLAKGELSAGSLVLNVPEHLQGNYLYYRLRITPVPDQKGATANNKLGLYLSAVYLFERSSQQGDGTLAQNPVSLALHKQRLWYGGTEKNPETLYASRVGNLYDFTGSTPVVATDAIETTVSATRSNHIQNMLSMGELFVFTNSAVWVVSAGRESDVPTPLSTSINFGGGYGSAPLFPIPVGNELFFLQRDRRKIRTLGFSNDVQSFIGNDLTVMIPELLENKRILDWAFQETPDPILWCVLSDGTFLSLTYSREQQVWAWSRHETQGRVLSVSVIPDGDEDRIFWAVERQGTLAVEVMDSRICIDGMETLYPVQGKITSDRFRNQTVSVESDGQIRMITFPSDGIFTPDTTAGFYRVGYPFRVRLETLPLVVRTDRILTGDRHAVKAASIRFKDSFGGQTGVKGGRMTDVQMPNPAFSETPAPQTVLHKVQFFDRDGKEPQIIYENNQPYPVTILSIFPEISIGGE